MENKKDITENLCKKCKHKNCNKLIGDNAILEDCKINIAELLLKHCEQNVSKK